MAEEYVLIRTPDILQLGELITRAKGPNRTMAQFAEECGVGASTLSRIANAKITKAVSLENLQAIYEHRDENADFSFELLARSDGFLPKEMAERFQSRRSSVERSRNDERCVQNTIVTALLDRHIGIQKLSEFARMKETKYPWMRPSLSFALKTVETVKKWDFYFFMGRLENDPERSNRVPPNSFVMMRLAERFSRLFLMDAWQPELLDETRSTIVFVDDMLFNNFVDTYKGAPIQTAITAMLIDTEKGQILREEWLSSKDEIPSLLAKKVIVDELELDESNYEEDKLW